MIFVVIILTILVLGSWSEVHYLRSNIKALEASRDYWVKATKTYQDLYEERREKNRHLKEDLYAQQKIINKLHLIIFEDHKDRQNGV